MRIGVAEMDVAKVTHGRVARFFIETMRGFLDHHGSLHAAGLTYFVVLSLIPVLCCILVAAKMAGVDRYAKAQINGQIDAMITNVEKGQDDDLAQLTAADEAEREKKRIAAEEFATQAREVSNALFERIEKFDVGTLGWVGFGFLLWTVISALGQVEVSFNEIWGVTKARPIWKRAYVYLFIIIVLPIFAALAMSLPVLNTVKNAIISTMGTVELMKWASDGLVWLLDSSLFRYTVTFVFSSATFGFFFWVMPNCRVCFRHAWYAGGITAVLFGAWLKICAVAQVGLAKSSALYGSFAFVPIVLAWLCMSWQLTLLGASMTHAFGVAGDERKQDNF